MIRLALIILLIVLTGEPDTDIILELAEVE